VVPTRPLMLYRRPLTASSRRQANDCSNNINVRLFLLDCLNPRVALEEHQPIVG